MYTENNKQDQQDWTSFLKGDRTAFSSLYQRYAKLLIQYGYKLNPKEEILRDTLQELFIELWNQRNQLANVQNVQVYLFKAFRYKLMRQLKKDRKQENLRIPLENYTIRASAETEWILNEMASNRTAIIRQRLNELPERQREVIHLKYFQGLSNSQISIIFQINEQSVANLLYRGLTKLRKKISKKSELW